MKKKKKTCRFVYKNYEYIDDETKYIQIDRNTQRERKNIQQVIEKKKKRKATLS